MKSLHRQLGFLYLTTGGNGAGKTLFTLRDVRALQLKEGRPVAYNGRFALKADFGWKKIDFKDWQAEPDGTIFLIDEAHNDMPVRQGANVPEHIRMLAEHRRRGFDFFIISQHPLNLDTFVRRLISAPGYHRHIKRMAGASSMASILRWTAVKENCEKEGAGATAEVELAAYPKEVYEWYDSASLHTGKRRIPKKVWTLVACVLLIPTLGAIAYKQLMNRYAPDKPEAASSGTVASGPLAEPTARRNDDRKPMTASEYAAAYRPRFPGLMHTAPAYDELTKPKRVPVAAACIEMASKGCKCFTQDATPYPIDLAMCQALVRHGSFYAFQAEGERQPDRAAGRPADAPSPQPVASSPGLILIGEAAPALAAPAPAPAAPPVQRVLGPRG